MYRLWKCALNPLFSFVLALAVCLLFCFSRLECTLATCFTLGLCYYITTPRVQMNHEIWRHLAHGHSHTVRLSDTGIVAGTRPVVIISFAENGTSWLEHALRYAHNDFRRFGLWACFCLIYPLTSCFRLPLARLAFWKMGGMVEYRRGVLIDLISRRSINVAVILQSPFIPHRSGGSIVRLQNKGMFGAFLRVNAVIIPAVSCRDGRVTLGSPFFPSCSGLVPTPLEVRNAVQQVSKELQRLHTEVFGSALMVED